MQRSWGICLKYCCSQFCWVNRATKQNSWGWFSAVCQHISFGIRLLNRHWMFTLSSTESSIQFISFPTILLIFSSPKCGREGFRRFLFSSPKAVVHCTLYFPRWLLLGKKTTNDLLVWTPHWFALWFWGGVNCQNVKKRVLLSRKRMKTPGRCSSFLLKKGNKKIKGEGFDSGDFGHCCRMGDLLVTKDINRM